MTSWVVSDAGIFIAIVMNEAQGSRAEQLLENWRNRNLSVAAPTLFIYEVTAAIRKHVARGTITVEEGIKHRDWLLTQPVELYADRKLASRAYELATELNRPTSYDAQYIALAERLSCEFWTADERLYNAVQYHLTRVKWVGNL